jgi:magnesium transporter
MVARVYRADQPPHEVAVADLGEMVADDPNFVWVDLVGHVAPDLRHLAKVLRLDDHAVRAALAPWRRPRLEVFGDHFFTTANVPHVHPRTRRVEAEQLDLLVGRNYLVSVHVRPLPFAESVATRAMHSPDLVRLDSAFMLYVVLDQLLAYYDELTERLEDELEALEERALREAADVFLEDLLRFKRYVFAVGRLAEQHAEVFTAYLRPDFRFVAGHEVEPYFRDLAVRLDRLIDRMTGLREAVNGAFDIYVSHVAHRTNRVMKTLAIVSTVVLPASIILGIFGTSVSGVPFYTAAGFIAMLALIAVVPGALLLWLWRRRWL